MHGPLNVKYLSLIDDSRFHFYFLPDNRNKASFWNLFDVDLSYTRVLHIKVAYRVPHK
jgi:hypothetical protein